MLHILHDRYGAPRVQFAAVSLPVATTSIAARSNPLSWLATGMGAVGIFGNLRKRHFCCMNPAFPLMFLTIFAFVNLVGASELLAQDLGEFRSVRRISKEEALGNSVIVSCVPLAIAAVGAIVLLHNRSLGRTTPVAAFTFIGIFALVCLIGALPLVAAEIQGKQSVRHVSEEDIFLFFFTTFCVSLIIAALDAGIIALDKRREWFNHL